MTTQQPVDLEQLRAIYAKMTPGEWADALELVFGHQDKLIVDCDPDNQADPDQACANAAGIVAIHNALPPLLDEVAALRREVERLTKKADGLLEQLSQQTKSFCSHCGKLFPKGKEGVTQFRQHIADCNAHPLHPLAKEVAKLREVATDIARGDPFHEHPDDAELAPGDVVMDYAAYRFAAKKVLEAKGA